MIGERIRDKVAASKARGMWMGGKVPLGYDVRDRKLVVNEAEAARVRRVFELFAETGSGVETVRRLRAEGVTSKSGRPLDKGDVYKLLHNRTYVGEVAHKGQVYPGEHQAIVPRELWDRAHAVLQESPRVAREPEPGADAGAAEGADLRRGRAGAVADPLPAARAALPLLRRPARAEGRRGRATTASCAACRPPRSRRRWWARCGRCCGSRRWWSALGSRRGPRRPT